MTGPRRSATRVAPAELLEAAEAERGLIADDLHDDAVQALTASVMHLSLLEARVPTLGDQPAYASARTNLEHGLAAARALLNDLRPPTLAARGARAAIAQLLDRLTQRTGCATHLDWRAPARMDARVQTVLFRAVQQALPPAATRTAKARAAAAVSVAAFPRRDGVAVEVTWSPAGGGPVALEPAPLAYQHVRLIGGTVDPQPAGRRGATIWLPLRLPADPED